MPGGALGVAAGLLLGSVWRYGAWDVALAVSAVFAGLVTVLLVSSAAWRPFAMTLTVFAGIAGAALLLLT